MPEILIPIKGGRKYCNLCDLLGLDDGDGWYCRVFDPHALNFLETVEGGHIKRCAECLEAEKKAKRRR